MLTATKLFADDIIKSNRKTRLKDKKKNKTEDNTLNGQLGDINWSRLSLRYIHFQQSLLDRGFLFNPQNHSFKPNKFAEDHKQCRRKWHVVF